MGTLSTRIRETRMKRANCGGRIFRNQEAALTSDSAHRVSCVPVYTRSLCFAFFKCRFRLSSICPTRQVITGNTIKRDGTKNLLSKVAIVFPLQSFERCKKLTPSWISASLNILSYRKSSD